MNNKKVRIYELSKELGLENKDILEICEQLTVPVKSHSSTITEAQADGIRNAAKSYQPKPSISKNSGARPTKNPRNSGLAKSPERPRPKGKRKEEILAIHHKNSNREKVNVSTIELEDSGDRKPKPVLTSPPRPIAPTQSLQPKPSQPSEVSQDILYPPSVSGPPLSDEFPPSKVVESASRPETVTASEATVKLKGPPEREMARPVASPPRPEGITPEIAAPKVTKLVTKDSNLQKTIKSLSGPKPLQPPSKPPITLSAPPSREPELLVVSTPESLKSDKNESEDLVGGDDAPIKSLLKPKRLSVTKDLKRKVWEEENGEEDKDSKGKTKGAGKNKRRTQILDDYDEDFEALTDSVATPQMVSLSVARPPKPKSMQSNTPTTTARIQRPPTKTSAQSGRNKYERRTNVTVAKPPEKVSFSGNLTIRELSEQLATPETDIIKQLFFKGIAVNITQTLDVDTASLVAQELGIEVEAPEEVAESTKTTEMLDEADLDFLQRRPPVVTIMGHVDHGKTTLLDSIRETKVAQGEAGGITQHIGAYHVDIKHDNKTQQIVFLDTPGHEAFTAMRARGTRITDIAILVVAADDGVQPQTKEAISHARAAGVPMIIAINKIDKPGAEADRVKQELTELELVPEEWGGDTIMVPVSALKGENLDTLLDMILLVSEIEELSANPSRPAKGTIIEAHLDRTRGPVATLLVQNGTLRVGETIVAGSVFGKIRAMIDDRGEKVEMAYPSFAVEILGLSDVPEAGDEFDAFPSDKEARAIANQRMDEKRQSKLQQAMSTRRVTLSSLSAQAQQGELKELNLILKADVQGSVEAILGSLNQLPQNEVQLRMLLAAPGEVTETDVDLAAASGAVVIGFNTTLASGAQQASEREGVDVREYNIIYKLLDDIQGAMEGLLDPEEVEESLGTAEVRAVFQVGRGSVAGCYVLSGKIIRNRLLRVTRSGKVIYEGVIDSLKRMKEDAREVNAGYECGIGSSKFNDWQEGDIIEAYEMVMKRRKLATV